MSFIKDLVKASGNEYANIVAEGVSAGDVDSFVDTGSYIFNALYLVLFMVDFQQTKSQQSQVNLQLVKHSLH